MMYNFLKRTMSLLGKRPAREPSPSSDPKRPRATKRTTEEVRVTLYRDPFSRKGLNVLRQLVQKGMLEDVRAYVNQHTLGISDLSQALAEAVRRNKLEIAEFLLDHGASSNTILIYMVPGVSDDHLITYAVRNNNLPMVRLFLDRGAVFRTTVDVGMSHNPIREAINKGYVDILDVLVRHAQTVQEKTIDARVFLQGIDAYEYKAETYRYLLHLGKASWTPSDLTTALLVTAEAKDYDTVRLLGRWGARDGYESDEEESVVEETALMIASKANDLKMVRILLEDKISVSVVNVSTSDWPGNKTALELAVDGNYIDTARVLLKYGARVTPYALEHAKPTMHALLELEAMVPALRNVLSEDLIRTVLTDLVVGEDPLPSPSASMAHRVRALCAQWERVKSHFSTV